MTFHRRATREALVVILFFKTKNDPEHPSKDLLFVNLIALPVGITFASLPILSIKYYSTLGREAILDNFKTIQLNAVLSNVFPSLFNSMGIPFITLLKSKSYRKIAFRNLKDLTL